MSFLQIRLKINSILNDTNGNSLKRLSARGGIWLSIGSGSENGLRLLRNMILARLIAPEAFGLMAIIMAVNHLFESFTQIGIKEAVIQNPKGNDKIFLNGAFFVSALRGIFLFILSYIFVPTVAKFYNKPDLIPMMRVAFLNIVFLSSMSPVAYSKLKKMNYKKWVFVGNGGCILGILITIGLGVYTRSVWALVLGFVFESFFRFVLSFILCPFIPGFVFDKESLHQLFKYMRGIFGVPILTFLFNRADIFVLGKLVTDHDLGVYNLVKNLAFMPFVFFNTAISQILMPIFASMQHDIPKLRVKFYQILSYIALVFLPILSLMACFSHQILFVVYGKAYTDSAIILSISCLYIALKIIGSSTSYIYFAIGRPDLYRSTTVIRLIVMAVCIFPLIKLWGNIGAAFSIVITSFAWFLIVGVKISQLLNSSFLNYLKPLSKATLISLSIITLGLIGRLLGLPLLW